MTRIPPSFNVAMRPALFATVLLFACAHAPARTYTNLSGRWEGNSVWTTRISRRTVFRSNLRFTMSLTDEGGEITGTGTVALADVPERLPVSADVYGSFDGERVHLRMVLRQGMHSVGFDGSVRGEDSMGGLVYDATVMDLGGWPSKNPIKLKRVGPALVAPLYPPHGL